MSHNNISADFPLNAVNEAETSNEPKDQLSGSKSYSDEIWNKFAAATVENSMPKSQLSHSEVWIPSKQDSGSSGNVREISKTYTCKSSGSILNTLNFKPKKLKKLSLIEQSKTEWDNFKAVEGLNEEFNTFNRGKAGFLQRQDFLRRTDLRQFEIERNLRSRNRKPRE